MLLRPVTSDVLSSSFTDNFEVLYKLVGRERTRVCPDETLGETDSFARDSTCAAAPFDFQGLGCTAVTVTSHGSISLAPTLFGCRVRPCAGACLMTFLCFSLALTLFGCRFRPRAGTCLMALLCVKRQTKHTLFEPLQNVPHVFCFLLVDGAYGMSFCTPPPSPFCEVCVVFWYSSSTLL
ncbi:unnamed protein product, partial [Pylaiella littoralis]